MEQTVVGVKQSGDEGGLDPELIQHIFSFLVFKDPAVNVSYRVSATKVRINATRLSILRLVCRYWNRLCSPFVRYRVVIKHRGIIDSYFMEQLGAYEKKTEEGPIRSLQVCQRDREDLLPLFTSTAFASSLQQLNLTRELDISTEVFSKMCREFCMLERLSLQLGPNSPALRDVIECLFADPASKVANTLTNLSLDLGHSETTTRDVASFATHAASKLRSLRLIFHLSEANLDFVHSFTALQALRLKVKAGADVHLSLSQLPPNLQHLSLDSISIKKEEFNNIGPTEVVPALSQLRTLRCIDCRNIQEPILRRTFPSSLTYLHLAASWDDTSELRQFSNPGPLPTGLLRLDVNSYTIDSISTTSSEFEPQKTELVLPQGVEWLSIFNDDRHLTLGSLNTSLVRLTLESCGDMRDSQLTCISTLTNLRFLKLKRAGRNTVTGSCLQFVPPSVHTVVLHFQSQMQDEAIEMLLHAVPNLKQLDFLANAQLTNKCMQYIGCMTNLELLDLAAVHNLSDEGMMHLSSLTKLEFLGLSSLRNVTNASLQYLRSPFFADVNCGGSGIRRSDCTARLQQLRCYFNKSQ